MKKLYLVSRTGRVGYDEYDACVVVAESPRDARHIHPAYGRPSWWNDEFALSSWDKPENLKVKFLGLAHKRMKIGVVLGSFNAG